jgi:peptidyl-prolyl cis-trans isomerase D
MMVEPFEKALFALPTVGSVSDPVRSPFGWHLIKLDSIEPVAPKPLADVRAQMEQDARVSMAENQFHDLADRLATLAYEHPDSLTPTAEQLGLKVSTSDWVDRAQGEGLAANAKVRQAAFSDEVLKQGRNSELLDLGQQQVAVVRVIEHEDAADQPFDAVRAQVEQRVIEQELATRMKTDAEILRLALAQAGEPANTLDAKQSFAGNIKRQAREVDADVARAAFAMKPPTEGTVEAQAVRLPSGDFAVVRLLSVKQGDPALLTAAERQSVFGELRQNQATSDGAVFDAYLRAKAKITQRQDI